MTAVPPERIKILLSTPANSPLGGPAGATALPVATDPVHTIEKGNYAGHTSEATSAVSYNHIFRHFYVISLKYYSATVDIYPIERQLGTSNEMPTQFTSACVGHGAELSSGENMPLHGRVKRAASTPGLRLEDGVRSLFHAADSDVRASRRCAVRVAGALKKIGYGFAVIPSTAKPKPK